MNNLVVTALFKDQPKSADTGITASSRDKSSKSSVQDSQPGKPPAQLQIIREKRHSTTHPTDPPLPCMPDSQPPHRQKPRSQPETQP